ncbi:hypothetical protein F5878DRAFT_647692 [Lentinula raphanica]|uniref:Uncharacterized protein n=1 Tax=Lentinula raphanica TaxID=153919 RepID=A0AA38NVP4_9AGAR|nr:hypothetical protein F5878DRAFT_647692 [Lentinula raphanica]
MLYTRTILLTMLLALAGAGSGVNAAPAHVCREFIPRGADGQEAQSQSPAPESSSKSTALGADGQEAPIQSSATSRYSGLRPWTIRYLCAITILQAIVQEIIDEQWKMMAFVLKAEPLQQDYGLLDHIRNIHNDIHKNPCGQPEGSEDRDATKILEEYYKAFGGKPLQ